MIFEPVWISSPAHLAECSRIMKSAGKITKALGSSWIPRGIPVLHAGLVFPCGFFVSGKLETGEGHIRFKAAYPDLEMMFSVERIDLKTEFTLTRSQITSVGTWKAEKAYARFFDFEWARITCDPSVLGGEILLAHGHKNFRRRRTAKQTVELLAALRRV